MNTATTLKNKTNAFLGSNTYPIIETNVDEVITVSESEIIDAMQLIFERLKCVIEPSVLARKICLILFSMSNGYF